MGEAVVEVGPDDWVRAWHWTHFRPALHAVHLTTLLVVAAALALAAAAPSVRDALFRSPILLLALVAMSLLAFDTYALKPRQFRKRARVSAAAVRRTVLRFDAKGLRIEETPHDFLVGMPGRQLYVVPKRALSPAAAEELRSLARRMLEKRYRTLTREPFPRPRFT